MKVSELKELLEEFPNDDEIIVCDSDGIIFTPLREVSAGYFFSENGFDGDFVSQEDAQADEDINLEDSKSVICFIPE